MFEAQRLIDEGYRTILRQVMGRAMRSAPAEQLEAWNVPSPEVGHSRFSDLSLPQLLEAELTHHLVFE